jgi:hypothetical protein
MDETQWSLEDMQAVFTLCLYMDYDIGGDTDNGIEIGANLPTLVDGVIRRCENLKSRLLHANLRIAELEKEYDRENDENFS